MQVQSSYSPKRNIDKRLKAMEELIKSKMDTSYRVLAPESAPIINNCATFQNLYVGATFYINIDTLEQPNSVIVKQENNKLYFDDPTFEWVTIHYY
jgi:hypothetical protein